MIIYNYKGFYGCACKCGLQVHKNLVIATEIPQNEGTSITNMAAELASLVCEGFEIEPSELIWIEHYPDRGLNERTGEYEIPEDFSLVTFKQKEKTSYLTVGVATISIFSSPVWHPIEKETVQGLVEAHTTKPETLKHWTDEVNAITTKKMQARNTGLPSSYFQ